MAINPKKGRKQVAETFDAIAQKFTDLYTRTGPLKHARFQRLAREWLMDKARGRQDEGDKSPLEPEGIMAARRKAQTSTLEVGKMYFFFYDPKHKKTLPYYDRFPLMIPIDTTEDGWLGLNLHYLPPVIRAKLLDALLDIRSNNRYDASTKLKLTYGILKSTAKFKAFSPCLKRYLNSHVRSSFLPIPANEWTFAVFLPAERFEKQSKHKVWSDSRRKIS